MATRRPLVKVALGAAVLTVVGLLFAATLRDVTSEPYIVRSNDLDAWTAEVSTAPDDPLLSLRPPRALPMALFDQVFQRTMASFTSPADPGIPLISRQEFETTLAGMVTPDELLALAREVGLETARLEPACMSVYRTTLGREQQLFFVLFDLTQFGRFRTEVTELLVSRGGDASRFDATALPPALLVAASEGALIQQMPRRPDLEADCEAPVASN